MNRTALSFAVALLACGLAAVGAAFAGEAAPAAPAIQHIYLVHFTHHDHGFTDAPSVCRELHQRFLDAALDTVLDTMGGPPAAKFSWTAEGTLAVDDWWKAATPQRREQFLQAVRAGQLDVAALPCNQTPLLDAAQWRTMLHWLPEDLWQKVKPAVAIQNDVNGLPRAGAVALLDRGVRHLFMGINSDSGGPPQHRPSAFWWKMPDGRRLFVWLSDSYPMGYFYFDPVEWRRGPVPFAADTRYRPPRSGDLLASDEKSLRKAQQHLRQRLQALQKGGYPYDTLVMSMTSQWRMDNDPPYAPLAEFVAAWNRLGLKPELRFTTATQAMQAMEKAAGPTAPQYEGEFTDWWANGSASGPREVAASRAAKRLLTAAQSPLWGKMSDSAAARLDAMYKDLCLFDEHTWGSSWSVALPHALDTQGQFTEKALLAYRPMAQADWLLSQRARTRLLPEGEGVFLANPSKQPFTGWVRFRTTALRGDFKSLEDPANGAKLALHFTPGMQAWGRAQKAEDITPENTAEVFPDNVPNQFAAFWAENLAAESFRRLRFSTEAVADQPASDAKPQVQADANGWPVSAQWPGMARPLFASGLADFSAVKVKAFAPRWALSDIAGAGDPKQREQLRKERLEEVPALADGPATRAETPHTLRFEQRLKHPRLKWAVRQMELWKREPRARVTLRLNRIASELPEAFFLAFTLPCEGVPPRASCGGMAFTPYSDQLPGSCRDYFAIDGWVHYAAPQGHWLWASRDVPLVTFGAPQVWARRGTAPADTHRVLAMLYNNFWYTNFLADQNGAMEFQFDLLWRASPAVPAALQEVADSLFIEPVLQFNPTGREDPRLMKSLFAP